MEPNFQTSFIPKKPIMEDKTVTNKSVGILLLISLFVLFITLVLTIGLYLYKGILQKNITKMQSALEVAKNRFEPAKINQLQVLDKRLGASSDILSKHVAVSPIFKALQDITMKTVRFTKFDYSVGGDKTGRVMVKMSGVADGYRSIALQSDLFNKNNFFINSVFSNLALDGQGNVVFDLEFLVDPSLVNYKNVLDTKDVSNVNMPVISDNEPLN